MSRSWNRYSINRRDLLKFAGAASAAAAVPIIRPTTGSAAPRAAQTGEKSAVIYFGGKPYSNWTGIRFWTNTGIPARMQWEPLLDLDDNLMPAPGLVEKWEVISNTVTRYHLQSGLTWSDGTPITTDDVVFSMNLTFHKDVADLMATEIATIKGAAEMQAGTADSVSGVRALDEQSFEIETAQPDVSVLRTLALRWWGPLPKHVYESIAPADLVTSEAFMQPPVVSGPFKIDHIEPDKWYDMSANTSYFRGKAKLDKVTYVIGPIGDPVALASQGKFDYYLARQPDIAAALAKDPNYTDKTVEYIQPYLIQLNASLPQFSDPRVRKAVAYAIDRETLSGQIYAGNATPQYTDFQGDLLDPTAEVYKYDPDMAKKLLSEANWDANEVLYFEQPAIPTGQAIDPIAQAQQAAYQQWLGDVGIKMELRAHPDSASYANFTLPPSGPAKFGAYENPHRRYDQYGPLELKTYLLSTPHNYAYWSNKDADALVQQMIAETDPGKYTALGRQLSILVAQECPYIPTQAVKWGIVSSKRFTGFTPIGEAYFAHMRPYDWDVTG
jgi:peptide/nickel transport system substrate-binding protein